MTLPLNHTRDIMRLCAQQVATERDAADRRVTRISGVGAYGALPVKSKPANNERGTR